MPLTPVRPGQIAAVVTHLEMRERPRPAPSPPSAFRLVRWKTPGPDKYRALYRRVGEPWLWFSRLVMPDKALATIIHDPAVEIYALCDPRGIEVGLLELDFREPGDCEIAFFGIVPPLVGKGHGKWMMAHALSLGWRKGIERLWVHSCTLDHPSALAFYMKAGFKPFAREIEMFDDPRIAGLLPRAAAPHIPLIDPDQPD